MGPPTISSTVVSFGSEMTQSASAESAAVTSAGGGWTGGGCAAGAVGGAVSVVGCSAD